MAVEIERKFLIKEDEWQKAAKGNGQIYKQGYILTDPSKTIRVRIVENEAFLTIKGKSIGASRPEFEYAIPMQDAEELLANFCSAVISKVRHKVKHDKHTWEVDEFLGDNAGLIIAEIELEDEQEQFEKPNWLDQEVTEDKRYFNSNLSVDPYSRWK